jgi:hypothetical protein
MPRQRKTAKKVETPPPKEEIEEEEDLASSEEEEEHEETTEVEEEEPEPVKKAPAKKKAPPKKPVKKAPVSKKASTKTTEEGDKPGTRYFRINLDSIKAEDNSPNVQLEDLSKGGGRYTGRNPMQAAKKAFTRIAKAGDDKKNKSECAYIFSIQETTQGSTKKVFVYRGTRRALETPQVVKKGDTTYNIYFDSDVRAYKPNKATTKK